MRFSAVEDLARRDSLQNATWPRRGSAVLGMGGGPASRGRVRGEATPPPVQAKPEHWGAVEDGERSSRHRRRGATQWGASAPAAGAEVRHQPVETSYFQMT